MLLWEKFSLVWPSFGLEFYTTLNLASLGTAWYKIQDLILPKQVAEFYPQKTDFTFSRPCKLGKYNSLPLPLTPSVQLVVMGSRISSFDPE